MIVSEEDYERLTNNLRPFLNETVGCPPLPEEEQEGEQEEEQEGEQEGKQEGEESASSEDDSFEVPKAGNCKQYLFGRCNGMCGREHAMYPLVGCDMCGLSEIRFARFASFLQHARGKRHTRCLQEDVGTRKKKVECTFCPLSAAVTASHLRSSAHVEEEWIHRQLAEDRKRQDVKIAEEAVEEKEAVVEKAGEEEEEEDVPERSQCVICMDRRKECIFMPCSHVVTCMTCGTREDLAVCPVCRQKIERRFKVFGL